VCSAGDVILWDSRTIHCNCPALVPPPLAVDEALPVSLLRVVGYVCMTPTESVGRALELVNTFDMKGADELLETRVRLYERRIGSSHWPHLLSSYISKGTSVPPSRDLWKEDPQRRAMVVGKERAMARREEKETAGT
jgi:hypothetical protein